MPDIAGIAGYIAGISQRRERWRRKGEEIRFWCEMMPTGSYSLPPNYQCLTSAANSLEEEKPRVCSGTTPMLLPLCGDNSDQCKLWAIAGALEQWENH